MSDLWWRITKMKKEAKSPAAIEHKRKYETEYESTPARKKYRRELERERRKRGVAGKGGKDMSHTKEGKIVPEEPHTNRARSHPSVGSTLKMVQVMKTEFAPPSERGDKPAASTEFDEETGKVGRSVVHGQPGMNPEEATRQVIHEDMHRATLPEVGLENMGHAEFPAMLGEELYLQRLAQEGNPHRKRDPHTLESSDPITEALYRTGKHSKVPREQQQKYIRAFAERRNPRVAKMVIVKAPQMNLSGHSAECEMCNAPMSGQEAAISNQQMGASVCQACLIQAQEQFNQENDMMFHSEPMDVVARLLKAPLHDVNTGEQVAGAPQPMTDFQAIDPNRNRFLPNPFEEDFKFLTDHIKAPKQYQYESPDKSTRGVVNVENNQANILGFTTHRDKRGEGRGTRALRNLTEELREVHPNLREINAMGGGGQDAFWEKMKREGVIKAPFPAKYGGNCVECGQYIQEGQPANFVSNPQRRGLKCPYNCGRAYVV